MLEKTIIVILISIIVLFIRLIVSVSIWERLIVLNLISLKIILMITVFAVLLNSEMALDVSLTYSIIGFVSVTTLSRLLLKGGRLK